jgi:hypothetical protein
VHDLFKFDADVLTFNQSVHDLPFMLSVMVNVFMLRLNGVEGTNFNKPDSF